MKKDQILVMAATIIVVLILLWLTTQSMTMVMLVGGVMIIGGIILLGIYSIRINAKNRELRKVDGLYDENHFYMVSMLIWIPFYIVLGLLTLKYLDKWYGALRNLQILFNVTMLILPSRLIFMFLRHRNKDRIRPRQPLPKGAKYVNAILMGIGMFYIIYEIYAFATGKPGI
jgi:hypothetical protein